MLPFDWVGVLATGGGTFGALAEADEPTIEGDRCEEEPRPPSIAGDDIGEPKLRRIKRGFRAENSPQDSLCMKVQPGGTDSAPVFHAGRYY